MKVTLYIFKIHRAFVEDGADAYIVRVHQCGSPKSRWKGVDSILELDYAIRPVFGLLQWDEVESALDTKGGYQKDDEIGEFEYHQLFPGT